MSFSVFIKKIKENPWAFTLCSSILCSSLWDYIFSPISNVAVGKLLSFNKGLINSFSNSIYRKISNGFSEDVSQILFTIVFMTLISFLFYLKSQAWQNYESFSKAVESSPSHSPDSHSQDGYSKEDSISCVEPDDLKKYLWQLQYQQQLNAAELNSLSMQLSRISENVKTIQRQEVDKARHSCVFVSLAVYVLIAFLFFSLASSSYVNTEITRLTNNIEIVSPYITDLEYKQLKSSYHSMASRTDYDSLNASLQEISVQYGIQLK